MSLIDLPDAELLKFARQRLHLRNAEAATHQPGPARQAVLLAYWAAARHADTTLQRVLKRPDFKRIAAGDAGDD